MSMIKSVKGNIQDHQGQESQVKISQENTRLFIGGLSQFTTEDNLLSYFQTFGEVKNVRLMYDSKTSSSRRFGFVTMLEYDSVKTILSYQPHFIQNKQIECKLAYPKQVPNNLSGYSLAASASSSYNINVNVSSIEHYSDKYNKSDKLDKTNLDISNNSIINHLRNSNTDSNCINMNNKYNIHYNITNSNSSYSNYNKTNNINYNSDITSFYYNNNNNIDSATRNIYNSNIAVKDQSDLYLKKLFLGGLKSNIGERDIVEYFISFGPISECFIKRKNNVSRGFGFLIFIENSSLNDVIEFSKTHQIKIKNCFIECKPAVPRDDLAYPTSTTNQNAISINDRKPNTFNSNTINDSFTYTEEDSHELSHISINNSSKEKAIYRNETGINSMRKLSQHSDSTEITEFSNTINNTNDDVCSRSANKHIFNEVLIFDTDNITYEAVKPNTITTTTDDSYLIDKNYYKLVDKEFIDDMDILIKEINFNSNLLNNSYDNDECSNDYSNSNSQIYYF